MTVTVGVLALQGSFREHISSLKQCKGVNAVEVRTKEDLRNIDGLIIPGGESTTMAMVADRQGLISDLQYFVKKQAPVWGTCAGLIFLADKATGVKEGGQALLGGLDCNVQRNFFGAQINSFETQLPLPSCLNEFGEQPTFRAVFIRAPGILEAGPEVEILSEYQLNQQEQSKTGRDSVIVAVRSGALLATAFHPELTEDTRWHELFVTMVRQNVQQTGGKKNDSAEPSKPTGTRLPNRPADLPIY